MAKAIIPSTGMSRSPNRGAIAPCRPPLSGSEKRISYLLMAKIGFPDRPAQLQDGPLERSFFLHNDGLGLTAGRIHKDRRDPHGGGDRDGRLNRDGAAC